MQKQLIALVMVAALSATAFYMYQSQGTQSTDINDQFAGILDGQVELTAASFQGIYNAYRVQFGELIASRNEIVVQDRLYTKIQEIIQHNSNTENTYKKGLNQFSHMTDEEFIRYNRLDQTAGQECSATNQRMSVARVGNDLPDTHDWREHGGVSPVKNQGGCGSCWTFSTVGALEAHTLIKYGKFVPLAEQQLVDCAGAFDNYGCSGGLPSHAFEYISEAGGISTETAYPYFAKNRPCTVDGSTFALRVNGGSVNITAFDEEEMRTALYNHGPVSIAFQVVGDFRDYRSGVYSSKSCKNGQQDVNHAVLAVGYGTENGQDYWTVKNSWGAAWGDAGYFKISRGVNMCGVGVCNSIPNEIELIE